VLLLQVAANLRGDLVPHAGEACPQFTIAADEVGRVFKRPVERLDRGGKHRARLASVIANSHHQIERLPLELVEMLADGAVGLTPTSCIASIASGWT
jgi:hypothetical protein